MKHRKFNLYLILFLGLSTVVHAEGPECGTCTKENICVAFSQMMEGVMNPNPAPASKQAVKALQVCAAENHPFAQYALAYAYETGTGVEQDKKRALEFYLKGGYGGSTAAMAMLVDYYNGAMGPGLKIDFAECYAWAAVGGKLGDTEVASRASLCAGTQAEKAEGEKRAESMLKKIKPNLTSSRVISCD